MHVQLTKYISRYIELSSQENEKFQTCLEAVTLKKKEFLLEPGQICKARYFVLKGCVRMFYIDPKGNEQITHFGIDKWWISDYESLINRIPSKLYIQAVEDTELLLLPESSFEKICQEIPQINTLFRIILEKTFVATQRRLEYMFSLSGEELFHSFISNNPAFIQRVPQYMIASYLGMTPEFISKLRKNIR